MYESTSVSDCAWTDPAGNTNAARHISAVIMNAFNGRIFIMMALIRCSLRDSEPTKAAAGLRPDAVHEQLPVLGEDADLTCNATKVKPTTLPVASEKPSR